MSRGTWMVMAGIAIGVSFPNLSQRRLGAKIAVSCCPRAAEMKSLRNDSETLYTNSAEEVAKSCSDTVRIQSRTYGSLSVQSALEP
ncbi:hypothetical protein D918_09692 [Trichuris suis]|nr:hypothetical protein D918_09692 [Trichuris suis]